jgi:hypothetical protein
MLHSSQAFVMYLTLVVVLTSGIALVMVGVLT